RNTAKINETSMDIGDEWIFSKYRQEWRYLAPKGPPGSRCTTSYHCGPENTIITPSLLEILI
ncbi:MAG: hypothetical protein WAV06_08600, partial [Terracidiphilus sp.]